MSILFLIINSSLLLMLAWTLWSGLKIDRTFDGYLMPAIDFVYEGSDWPKKRLWLNSLDAHAKRAIWHPFKLPRHCIQGEYAAEFFRWLDGKKQDRELIKAAAKDVAHVAR